MYCATWVLLTKNVTVFLSAATPHHTGVRVKRVVDGVGTGG